MFVDTLTNEGLNSVITADPAAQVTQGSGQGHSQQRSEEEQMPHVATAVPKPQQPEPSRQGVKGSQADKPRQSARNRVPKKGGRDPMRGEDVKGRTQRKRRQRSRAADDDEIIYRSREGKKITQRWEEDEIPWRKSTRKDPGTKDRLFMEV